MPHSGYKRYIVMLAVVIGTLSTACVPIGAKQCREYNDKDIEQFSTLVRVTMDIVSSEYEQPLPALIPEEKIKELIQRRGTPFKELELLDQYELIMVSHEGQWAAVAWEPGSDQKILQDLRCTKKLDEASWKSCSHGHEMTLDWQACN